MPISGEFEIIQRPKNEDEILTLLSLTFSANILVALDGSTWWFGSLLDSKTENELNTRATKFINERLHPVKPIPTRTQPFSITGKAICLSVDETRKLFHWREQMIPLYVGTYPVKDELKVMGARWLNNPRVWVIPESRLDDALNITR